VLLCFSSSNRLPCLESPPTAIISVDHLRRSHGQETKGLTNGKHLHSSGFCFAAVDAFSRLCIFRKVMTVVREIAGKDEIATLVISDKGVN